MINELITLKTVYITASSSISLVIYLFQQPMKYDVAFADYLKDPIETYNPFIHKTTQYILISNNALSLVNTTI
jgi:hypothetical protein